MRRLLGSTAAAALNLLVVSQAVWAQRPPPELPVFGHTLHQGTGYIATPHAMVSQGAFYITATAIAPEEHIAFEGADPGSYTATRGAIGLALNGWIEVGGTIHRADAYTAFGKLQLVKQQGIFPGIAAGVHNLKLADDIGRYGIEDVYYNDFFEQTSFFAVFTYVAGPGRTPFPSWVTISGGYGTGIFAEDNPQIDGDRSAGLFGAVSFDFQAGDEAYLRFITEYDGYEINLAAVAWLAGLQVTIGALSVGQGDPPDPQVIGEPFDPTKTFAGQFYNQVKPFASLTLDLRSLGAIPWIWTEDED
jgi:hypothetical protein